jgi:S-adenosylmethionine:diacylglycerol 3-amino-3-carboxypropyl transferase
MALAPHHDVVAVDINPVQLAYAERRFAGDRGAPGTAERLMGVGRSLAPLVGWWPSRVRTFLAMNDTAAQTEYWRQHLNTWRFRASFDGLLSLTALRAVYAAPFLDFLPPHLGSIMRARMARCFALHPNHSNPYARALLLGELSDAPTPPQAKDVRLVHADAAAFLELQPAGSFDGFALSNILDGAKASYRRRLFTAVKRAAAPDAQLVLRSFREASAALPANRAADDRAMLWGIVDVRAVSTLT